MPFGRAAEQTYTDAERIRYWWEAERTRLLRLIEGLAPAQRTVPLADGCWSPHAVVAHRVFWEAREQEALEQYLEGRRPELLDFPLKRIDAANAISVKGLRGQQTAVLLRALTRLRADNRKLVRRIADADLNTAGNAARLLLGVALEHDREHRIEIEAWLTDARAG